MATEKPLTGEIAAIGPDDIGAKFAGELRLANDDILEARGKGDLAIYDRVLSDWQVQAVFGQLRAAIVSRPWIVEPGGLGAIDVLAADALREDLNAVPWDEITRKMMMGAWYGYSVGEAMFAIDGRVRLSNVLVRKARRFRFGREGELRLVRKNDSAGVAMPPKKFWIFKAAANDDDDVYPLGLGYYCYWLDWFSRNLIRYWALWCEKFAQPTPVVTLPAGTNDEVLRKAVKDIDAALRGGRIAVPENIKVALLEALQRAGDDYLKFIEYLDRAKSKVIVGQTMTTDDGSSRAQGEVHERVGLHVVRAWSDMLHKSFVDSVGTWLTEWNFPGAVTPHIYRDYRAPVDDLSRAERDNKIQALGFAPTQAYIDETYGVGWAPRSPRGDAEPSAPDPRPEAELAEPEVVGPTDAVVDDAAGDWRAAVGQTVDDVEQLLDEASSLEAFRDRLGEIIRKDPDAATERLARIMFAGSVAGQTGADIEEQEE